MDKSERQAIVAHVNSVLRTTIIVSFDICFYSSEGTILFPIRPGNRYHMLYLTAPQVKLNWGVAVKTSRLNDESYLMRRINREFKRFESYLKTI
jgi:hypothetical protein